MARATVTDPRQAAEVESYLNDPSIPGSGKRQFLELFHMRSATTGDRLNGTPPAPFDGTTDRADDRYALAAVIRWKADPSRSPLEGEIHDLERRLRGWVRQAPE